MYCDAFSDRPRLVEGPWSRFEEVEGWSSVEEFLEEDAAPRVTGGRSEAGNSPRRNISSEFSDSD